MSPVHHRRKTGIRRLGPLEKGMDPGRRERYARRPFMNAACHMPRSSPPRLTLSDRMVAAAVGVVIGAAVGAVVAWLVGVYSNTLGVAAAPVSFPAWVGACAGFFGAIGLLFGPSVGTLLGHVIRAIFEFERFEPPVWLVLLLLAVAALFFWFLS